MMIAGGFDDISEEGSYEFANMKATSNAETEFAMGREPTEMSRPATTTRAGFMEAQVRAGSLPICLMTRLTSMLLGYWCPYCDEREDRFGAWCSHSWCPRLHFNIHVRVLH